MVKKGEVMGNIYHRTLGYTQALIALIPAALGILAFANDITGYQGTIAHVVHPILCMEKTFGIPAQTWRAICYPAFTHGATVLVMTLELGTGLLALWGAYRMARAVPLGKAAMRQGVAIVSLACLLGFVVWVGGFYVVLGDWFLAWQDETLNDVRLDGAVYGTVVLLCLFAVNYEPRD